MDVGDQFGRHRLVERLGVGGMAQTFLAVQRGAAGFEQRVCMKFMLPIYHQDTTYRRLFLREASIAASLRHSNIVSVIDVDEDAGYIVLELVDGVDLRALLRSLPKRQLAPHLVVLIAIELCKALSYAHGRVLHGLPDGVVHRDVSPSNVLISYAGEVKLTDFGVARSIRREDSEPPSDTVKGKLCYMSPEQTRAEELDGRSDLFSVGVLCYELLAGRRPFDGQGDADTLARILGGRCTPLRERVPEVPEALAQVVTKLLATDRDERFANAQACIDAFAPLSPGLTAFRELGELASAARPPKTIIDGKLSERARKLSKPPLPALAHAHAPQLSEPTIAGATLLEAAEVTHGGQTPDKQALKEAGAEAPEPHIPAGTEPAVAGTQPHAPEAAEAPSKPLTRLTRTVTLASESAIGPGMATDPQVISPQLIAAPPIEVKTAQPVSPNPRSQLVLASAVAFSALLMLGGVVVRWERDRNARTPSLQPPSSAPLTNTAAVQPSAAPQAPAREPEHTQPSSAPDNMSAAQSGASPRIASEPSSPPSSTTEVQLNAPPRIATAAREPAQAPQLAAVDMAHAEHAGLPSSASALPSAAVPHGQGGQASSSKAKRTALSKTAARNSTSATLDVGVMPFGKVWVDGKAHGYAPKQISLSPGHHVIAAGESQIQDKHEVVLEPGDQVRVVVDLDEHKLQKIGDGDATE